MSTETFTPGPWHWVSFAGEVFGDDWMLATGDEKNYELLSLEEPANRSLIGAAPELLEALELLWLYVGFFDGDDRPHFHDARAKVEAAIAKAKGNP